MDRDIFMLVAFGIFVVLVIMRIIQRRRVCGQEVPRIVLSRRDVWQRRFAFLRLVVLACLLVWMVSLLVEDVTFFRGAIVPRFLLRCLIFVLTIYMFILTLFKLRKPPCA